MRRKTGRMENAVLRRATRQCIGATLKVLELFGKFRPISSLRDASFGGNGGGRGTVIQHSLAEFRSISPSFAWGGLNDEQLTAEHRHRYPYPIVASLLLLAAMAGQGEVASDTRVPQYDVG